MCCNRLQLNCNFDQPPSPSPPPNKQLMEVVYLSATTTTITTTANNKIKFAARAGNKQTSSSSFNVTRSFANPKN